MAKTKSAQEESKPEKMFKVKITHREENHNPSPGGSVIQEGTKGPDGPDNLRSFLLKVTEMMKGRCDE